MSTVQGVLHDAQVLGEGVHVPSGLSKMDEMGQKIPKSSESDPEFPEKYPDFRESAVVVSGKNQSRMGLLASLSAGWSAFACRRWRSAA